MTTATEAMGALGQAGTALQAGLDVLDLNYEVTFTLYRKVVSPIDGYVFWVRGDIVVPSAYPDGVYPEDLTFQVKGSLHHTTINNQDPDESFSTNRMIFTTGQYVNDLADIDPQTMYLAETNGQRYTFSTRSGYYRQVDLYHYSGDAVYPTMDTQIIDSADDLNLHEPVVSNSLPIWLRLNSLFPVYPAMLVPDNKRPPYAVINIGEEDTTPMQAAPVTTLDGSR